MATRTIDTQISLGGEKEFNDKMKAVNSNLKTLGSEMAVVTAEFADNADSAEALGAKNKVLSQIVDQQKEKVRALNEMYEDAAKVKGADSKEADKWRTQLNRARTELIKQQRELDKNQKAMDALSEAAEETADATAEVAEASEDVTKEVKKEASEYSKLTGKYHDVTEAIEKFTKKYEVEIKLLGKAGSAVGGTIKTLGKLAAAGTAATGAVAALAIEGIKTLTEYAKEAAENGDPAFTGLAENLTALDGASKSAKAALGAVLLPALESLSGGGVQLLNDFSAAMAATNGDTEKMGEVISEYIGKAVDLIKENMPMIMKLGGDLIEGLSSGLIENAPQMLDDAQIIIMRLLDGITQHSGDIGAGAVKLIKSLSDMLIHSAPDLIKAGGDIVIELLNAMPELITTLIEGILSRENLEAIAQIGVGIVKAIWNGISSMLSWLWDKIQGMFAGKKITPPEIDTPDIPGYAGGLDYVPYDNFLARLHRGETVLTAQEAAEYRRGDGGTGGNVINITFNAQQVTEADVDMIVDTVNRRLGGD